MQTARLGLQMSQKDLAAKINEKQSVLADIESGKALANPQILGKIERQLGVKLRGMSTFLLDSLHQISMDLVLIFSGIGNDIGAKLEGPKKSSTSA